METVLPLLTSVLPELCSGCDCNDDDCSHGPTEWAMCEADRRPTLHTYCLLALADKNGDLIYFANEVVQPDPANPTLSIDPLEQILIETGLDQNYPDDPIP